MSEGTKTPGDAPVAWRIQELSGKWVATIDQDAATRWRERGWTVEPLYSAPALNAFQARQRELEEALRPSNEWLYAQAEQLSSDKGEDAVGALAWNLGVAFKRRSSLLNSPAGEQPEGCAAPSPTGGER